MNLRSSAQAKSRSAKAMNAAHSQTLRCCSRLQEQKRLRFSKMPSGVCSVVSTKRELPATRAMDSRTVPRCAPRAPASGTPGDSQRGALIAKICGKCLLQ